MNKRLLLIVIPLFGILSCHKNVREETTVYNNDFETNNLSGISNGVISKFNGSAVLGNFNNSYFILTVNNLPKHNLVTVSYDLYIHDTWDGNKQAPDGPDIWEMLVDGNAYINTTFSNADCPVNYFCTPQSYPFDYPNNYSNPKSGASRTDLPGFCSNITSSAGTTLYKIKKTITHDNKTLTLQCFDKLVQTNTADPKCDESWSVDNIKIQTITF